MGSAISISKEAFITRLHEAVHTVKDRYGIPIRFVEIRGKRWSFLAGVHDTLSLFMPPERIMLTDGYGIVSDQLNTLSSEERAELIAFLKEVIKHNG